MIHREIKKDNTWKMRTVFRVKSLTAENRILDCSLLCTKSFICWQITFEYKPRKIIKEKKMKAAIADNSLSAVSQRADELLSKGEIGWDPHELFFTEEMNVRNQWQNHSRTKRNEISTVSHKETHNYIRPEGIVSKSFAIHRAKNRVNILQRFAQLVEAKKKQNAALNRYLRNTENICLC